MASALELPKKLLKRVVQYVSYDDLYSLSQVNRATRRWATRLALELRVAGSEVCIGRFDWRASEPQDALVGATVVDEQWWARLATPPTDAWASVAVGVACHARLSDGRRLLLLAPAADECADGRRSTHVLLKDARGFDCAAFYRRPIARAAVVHTRFVDVQLPFNWSGRADGCLDVTALCLEYADNTVQYCMIVRRDSFMPRLNAPIIAAPHLHFDGQLEEHLWTRIPHFKRLMSIPFQYWYTIGRWSKTFKSGVVDQFGVLRLVDEVDAGKMRVWASPVTLEMHLARAVSAYDLALTDSTAQLFECRGEMFTRLSLRKLTVVLGRDRLTLLQGAFGRDALGQFGEMAFEQSDSGGLPCFETEQELCELRNLLGVGAPAAALRPSSRAFVATAVVSLHYPVSCLKAHLRQAGARERGVWELWCANIVEENLSTLRKCVQMEASTFSELMDKVMRLFKETSAYATVEQTAFTATRPDLATFRFVQQHLELCGDCLLQLSEGGETRLIFRPAGLYDDTMTHVFRLINDMGLC